MISLPSGVRVWLACGTTDMRKGMDGLAMLIQQVLAEDPFSGALFAFRGKRGGLVKLLWYDGQGMCLFSKRLEKGRFGLTDMYGARMYSTERLIAELTVRDGKVVYDLNGISRPDWRTLPANYGQTGDARWDGLNPAAPTRR